MPASILQGVFEIIAEVVLEFGCHFVGRVVVPVLSLGRVRCEKLTAETPRHKLRGARMYYRSGSQVYLTPEGTTLAGLVVLALSVAVGVFFWLG